jgi:predicted glutamine amidotransferase
MRTRHLVPRFPLNQVRRVMGMMLCGICVMMGMAPALACRMVTIVQATPQASVAQDYLVNHSRSLMHQAHDTQPFYQTAGQSLDTNMLDGVVPTVDGAGLVGFKNSQLTHYYRQGAPLGKENVAFKNAVSTAGATSSVLMGHIRAKTQGDIEARNSHPFVATLAPNQTWSFMDNGGTQITPERYLRDVTDTRLLESLSKAKTHVDTEMLFHLLLQNALPQIDGNPLDASDMSRVDDVAQTLASTFSKIQSEIPPSIYTPFSRKKGYAELATGDTFHEDSQFLRYWPKTWVMSNGNVTFIMVHGYEQWVQIHSAQGIPTRMVFASEPTNIKEFYQHREHFPTGTTRWQQLPKDSLTAVYTRPDGSVQMKLYPVVFKQNAYPAVDVDKRIPAKTSGAPVIAPRCRACSGE